MDLSTLFEIIGKYGWWSLLIAAGMGLIYICVKLVASKITDGVRGGMDNIAHKLTGTVANQLQELSSTNSSQLEMLSQNIAKQNNELVKAMGIQNEKLLSYIMHSKQAADDIHDKKVEQRMDIAETIINKLREIMMTAHAQRAFIIEFHNSFKNLGGTPFAKYTCTYEWFDKGLDQIGSKCVAMPYSSMAKIVGDVKRTGVHQKLYTDIEKMKSENPQLFSLLGDSGTLAVFYNMLYDDDNKMTGMLVLEWQADFDISVWDRAKMPEYLSHESIQISTWLNLKGPSIESNEIEE
jgi:hypothetical protein